MNIEEWTTVINALRDRAPIGAVKQGEVAGAAVTWDNYMSGMKPRPNLNECLLAVDIFLEEGGERFPGPKAFRSYIIMARKEAASHNKPHEDAETRFNKAVAGGRVTTKGTYYNKDIFPPMLKALDRKDYPAYQKVRDRAVLVDYGILWSEKQSGLDKEWHVKNYAILDELEVELTPEQKEKARKWAAGAKPIKTN